MIELAWAAGFFDGEGSTYRRSGGQGQLRVRVSQVEREPLERFRAAVGVGQVRGPYKTKNPRGQPIHEYVACANDAIYVMEKLRPYLCRPKREQLDRAEGLTGTTTGGAA